VELTGTEEISLELGGHIDADRAALLAGPGLDVVERRGRVRIGLLVLQMRGLGLGRGPLRLSYGEALWRLSVLSAGRPAWLALACDLDRFVVRWLAARLIRYPVRAARIDLRTDAPDGIRCEVRSRAGRLRLSCKETHAQPPAEPPRPLLVRERPGGRIFSVPWGEAPAPERRAVILRADDPDLDLALARATFGEAPALVLDRAGVLHRGRLHRCGAAVPAVPPGPSLS
jgi:hypothetical protein